MRLQSRWARVALLIAVLALLASACRSDDTADEAEEAVDDAVEEAEDAAAEAEEDAEEAVDEAEETADEAMEEEDDAMEEEEEGDGGDAAGDVATDVGVTEEACPDAVNPDNGCIYLGILSDLSAGPFVAFATELTEAQVAFWNAVNEDGGIAGYDVDVSEHTRDNLYDPDTHAQQYNEIKDDVLGLAQTLGSPTTAAIIDDVEASQIVAAPASWTSGWLFSQSIVESGNTYCIESQNAIDWALENLEGPIESVLAVHLPGDYGDDGAAGAQIAAEANGMTFADVVVSASPEEQSEAVNAIVEDDPDLVIVTNGPAATGALFAGAVQGGWTGTMITNSPGWNVGLLENPAFQQAAGQFYQASPWQVYGTDSPGHEAMRQALGNPEPSDGYTSGWVWSYPVLAVLQQAADNGDLTREGVYNAVAELTEVDYEGMLPEGSGNFAGDPNGQAVRATIINAIDPATDTGLVEASDGFYTGPTAADFDFGDSPCFESLGG